MIGAAEIRPGDLTGLKGEDGETDFRIRGPCGRIALAQHAKSIRVDLEALEFRDRRFVHARECDVPLIGRPPVSGVAIHFLLRDELGDSMTDEPATAGREPTFSAARYFDGIEILVADEADIAAFRRILRVGLVGLGRRQLPQGLVGRPLEIVVIQVATEREKECMRIRRPLIFDDATQRRSALALATGFFLGRQRLLCLRETARIDQQTMLAYGDVIGPQVEDLRIVVLGPQIGDERAIRRKPHLAQRRSLQVGRIEQPLDRQVTSAGGGCQGKARRDSNHE